MSNEIRIKRPGDRLDYDVDFEPWLEGDTISDASAEVTTEDADVEEDGVEFTDTSVKVWLTGGEEGERAHVNVTIETAAGRTKEICFLVRVKGC
jgi:hypothetical protein